MEAAEDEDVKRYIEALRTHGQVDPEGVERMMERYPYFTLPVATALSQAPGDGRDAARLARVALASPDAEELMRLADRDSDTWRDFYPPDKPQPAPTTQKTIDTFLETYGHGASDKEDDLMERLIFNPVPADYAATLDAEAAPQPQRPKTEQDKAIDDFLDHLANADLSPQPEPEPEPVVHNEPHAETLSESLAKIYVKQGKLDKAYEIINSLNLNFPKKSAYFADQLRFLRKLMLNREFSQRNNIKKP